MTGNGAVDSLLLVAAILGGLVTIGVSVHKIWQFLDGWEDALSTLKEIADQFKPDSGDSLHDRISTLEQSTRQIQRDLESVLVERTHAPNVVRAELDEPDGTPI